MLGHAHSLQTWLDKPGERNSPSLENQEAIVKVIQAVAEQLAPASLNPPGQEKETLTGEVEGGPKIQESPPEIVDTQRLCTEVDICTNLKESQKRELFKVLSKNMKAFGLDGRLGNYDAKVEIKLKSGTNPISLPPYNASPAKGH